ncbi:MAG TPA: PhoU domain-containing protein [Chroococcales cyanobacterium]
MKPESIMMFKEDVLALGQMVCRTVEETGRMLRKDSQAALSLIEQQEPAINQAYQDIEEKCLDLLLEKDTLAAKEIRILVGSTIIASKFERLADHANRVARIASWAWEDKIEVPPELNDMVSAVQRMLQEVLLCFLTDDAEKARDILQRDNEVDYLDDLLSKKLLSDLGDQDSANAQMRAQFLFCARFLERMGDLTTSIAKRSYFIATGNRIKAAKTGIA